MKDIYVFDMGHVILKPSNLKKMYLESCSNCNYDEFKKLFYDSSFSNDVYSGLINDDMFFKAIKEKSNSKKTIKQLKTMYLKYKGEVYLDTIEIIKNLKENRSMICLLSNLKEIDYQYLSSVVDMSDFDKVFLSYMMNCAKPDPKIFQKVIQELGTNNFYFFDDNEENILTAKELGIDAYNVTGDTIKECFVKKLKR